MAAENGSISTPEERVFSILLLLSWDIAESVSGLCGFLNRMLNSVLLIMHIVWSQHFHKYPHVLHPKQQMPPWKVDINRLHTGHNCIGNLFGSMENHSVACWDPITIYYTGTPSQIAFIVSILIFLSGFNSYCLYYVKRHSNVSQKQKDPFIVTHSPRIAHSRWDPRALHVDWDKLDLFLCSG